MLGDKHDSGVFNYTAFGTLITINLSPDQPFKPGFWSDLNLMQKNHLLWQQTPLLLTGRHLPLHKELDPNESRRWSSGDAPTATRSWMAVKFQSFECVTHVFNMPVWARGRAPDSRGFHSVARLFLVMSCYFFILFSWEDLEEAALSTEALSAVVATLQDNWKTLHDMIMIFTVIRSVSRFLQLQSSTWEDEPEAVLRALPFDPTNASSSPLRRSRSLQVFVRTCPQVHRCRDGKRQPRALTELSSRLNLTCRDAGKEWTRICFVTGSWIAPIRDLWPFTVLIVKGQTYW